MVLLFDCPQAQLKDGSRKGLEYTGGVVISAAEPGKQRETPYTMVLDSGHGSQGGG